MHLYSRITVPTEITHNNLLATMAGTEPKAAYDGYASCPLLTGHGELMPCEFKYGGVPKETFAGIVGDQAIPNAPFYYLKKNIFVSNTAQMLAEAGHLGSLKLDISALS